MFAALSTSLLSGCADLNGDVEMEDVASAPTVGHVAQAIVGGQTDNTHTAVLAVASVREQGHGLCSGTLIAPNVVLTAQHCVAPTDEIVNCKTSKFAAPYAPVDIFVSTATQVDGGANFYPVKEVHVPQNDSALCGNDIALLILEQPLSGAIVPIAPRLDKAARSGELYTAIGFGDAQSDGDAGVRRERSGLEVTCGVEQCRQLETVVTNEFVGAGSVCEGDSGGPALDKDGQVIGVVSRGAATCESSVYAAVAPQADWIRSITERAIELGSYRAPVWYGGAAADAGTGTGASLATSNTASTSSVQHGSTTSTSTSTSTTAASDDHAGIRLGSHAGCSVSLPSQGSREASILSLLGAGLAVASLRARRAR